VTEYLAAGGRILTTGSMYSWYSLSSDPALAAVGVIPGNTQPQPTPYQIQLDGGFPKGKALVEWLQAVFPTMSKGLPNGFFPVWNNITSIDATKAQVWGIDWAFTNTPRIFSVNTPAGKPVTAQCGKGVHIDAYVNRTGGTEGIGGTFPADPYCSAPTKQPDGLFTFFFFDNATCIQKEIAPPMPPPTTP
jgi:hypothetical protein